MVADRIELDVVPGATGEAGPDADLLRDIPAEVRLATDPNGTWYVLWRSDVEALLHDRRLRGIGLSLFDLMGITDGPLRDWYSGIMFTNEGETHHRLRTLVQKAFTPRAIDTLRPFAATESAALLDPIRVNGHGDLIDLAFHLPIRAMAELLGVPQHDIDGFTGWSTDLAHVFGYMTPEQIAAATEALSSLRAYVRELLDARQEQPGDDLISALLAAEEAGDRLTHDECIDMVVNLLVGGHDTTTSQIACSLFSLFSTPGSLEALAADPELVPSAVEETIRHTPGIGVVPRVAVEPVTVGDHVVPEGALLMLVSSVANRDADVFDRPGELDLSRFDGRDHAPPARVLSFGAGAHYCLGAAMARMLVREAVGAVAALPAPVVLTEPPATIPWTRVLGEYPARLPVTCGSA